MSDESMAERGLLMENWHAKESVDSSTGFWGDGRRFFSRDQLLRYMDADRVLEAYRIITAEERRCRGEKFQEIGKAIGMPQDLLTSHRTRRIFRSSPRRGPSGAA